MAGGAGRPAVVVDGLYILAVTVARSDVTSALGAPTWATGGVSSLLWLDILGRLGVETWAAGGPGRAGGS